MTPMACGREETNEVGFLEGKMRALGDKALFSNLIITLQEKRREEREEEKKRRGEERRRRRVPPLESGSQRGRLYNLLCLFVICFVLEF